MTITPTPEQRKLCALIAAELDAGARSVEETAAYKKLVGPFMEIVWSERRHVRARAGKKAVDRPPERQEKPIGDEDDEAAGDRCACTCEACESGDCSGCSDPLCDDPACRHDVEDDPDSDDED